MCQGFGKLGRLLGILGVTYILNCSFHLLKLIHRKYTINNLISKRLISKLFYLLLKTIIIKLIYKNLYVLLLNKFYKKNGSF